MASELSDELLNCVEGWAERLANCLGATRIPMPPQMHVQGLTHSMELTLMEMKAVLQNNDREVPHD